MSPERLFHLLDDCFSFSLHEEKTGFTRFPKHKDKKEKIGDSNIDLIINQCFLHVLSLRIRSSNCAYVYFVADAILFIMSKDHGNYRTALT